jgi:hypothetical protein
LARKTQHHYIRHVKSFADFLGRSPDKATAEDVHRYQLWLASIGATVPTVNAGASALRFFFKVTLKRSDLANEVVSARELRRLPVDSKEEAIEWVKRCPDPFPGGECKIEIRQVFEPSDFETMTLELREQEERLRATARGEGRALRWGALDVGLRAPKSPGTSRTRRSVLSALGMDRR